MSATELPIGCTGSGALHADTEPFDVEKRFRMVKESGAFDYFDRTPLPGELDLYKKCSADFALPIRGGGFFYALGRDEPLLEWHLRIGADLGAIVHNVQIGTFDAAGKPVTDQQVVDAYLRAYDIGANLGIDACFEVHVNMWSEHYGRIQRVAEMVEARGIPYNMTLDCSHIIFKIDNPEEQAVQNMRADIDAGTLELNPAKPNHVCGIWIERNWIRHCHARAAAPGGPKNAWMNHPNGKPGRGIQYPFVKPEPGQWHAAWNEEKLEPWKMVMRQLMRHHAENPASRLRQISTEFIPNPDYGGGAKYSIFEQNVACAKWLRAEWQQISPQRPAT